MKKHIITIFLAIAFLGVSSSASAANIEQTVQFDDVSPERLFAAFSNAKEHSAVLKMPVEIAPKSGSVYKAFDGKLIGTVIGSSPGKQLILSWRTWKFEPVDTDSILVLTFVKNEKGSQIEMVHANVPDRLRNEVNAHWNIFYWDAWRAYMKNHK